jgi:hypothetical protein
MSLIRDGLFIISKGCLRPPSGGFYSPNVIVVKGADGILHEIVGEHNMRWPIPVALQGADVLTAYYKGWEEISTIVLFKPGHVVSHVELLLRSETKDGIVLHCVMKAATNGRRLADAPYTEMVPGSKDSVHKIVAHMIGQATTLEEVMERAIIWPKATNRVNQLTAVVDLYLPREIKSPWTTIPLAHLQQGTIACEIHLIQIIDRLVTITSSALGSTPQKNNTDANVSDLFF